MSIKHQSIKFFTMILCAIFIISCSDDDKYLDNAAQVEQKSIVSELNKNSNLSDFTNSFKSVDLSASQATGLTVFAVDNSAWTVAEQRSESSTSVSVSEREITHYIVEGKFDIEALLKKDGTAIKTLSGLELTVRVVADNVYLNGIKLTVVASEGVNAIYSINAVLPISSVPLKKRLLKAQSTVDGSYFSFNYDQKGRLIDYTEFFSKDDSDNTKTILSYNDDQTIAGISVLNDKGIEESKSTYKYNGDNIFVVYTRGSSVVKDTLVLLPGTQRIQYTKCHYKYNSNTYTYDDNYNLIKIDGQDGKKTFEYDNKTSLFANTTIPSWFAVYNEMMFETFFGLNNLISHSSGGELFSKITYKYDQDGYPTSMYITYPDDDDDDDNLSLSYEILP